MFLLKRLSITTVFILTGCVSLAPEYQRPTSPVPQQFSLSRNSLTPVEGMYQDTGWRNFFVAACVRAQAVRPAPAKPPLALSVKSG